MRKKETKTDTEEKIERNYNEKSKKNLIQFREDGDEASSKASFLKRLDELGVDSSVISTLLPADSSLKAAERSSFYEVVLLYIKDFEVSDLSSSDIGDIVGLAVCKILEARMLAASKGSDVAYIDVVNAAEKIHRREEKLKESLAARRSDRIDIRKKGGVSIVDLAAMTDEEEEVRLKERVAGLVEQNKKAREDLKANQHEDS